MVRGSPDDEQGLVRRTRRTRVRRKPERAVYDGGVVNAILDEALVCHVGFVEQDQPYVLPMAHCRIDAALYLHGARSNHMLRALAAGTPACLTATIVDGLVLARSAVHHSMNYRSVVVLGTTREVRDATEKMAALEALVEHVLPGRWANVRTPTASELSDTIVVSLPIDECSAKVRAGPPLDDDADRGLPVWAGELPLHLAAAALVPCPSLPQGTSPPAGVQAYRRTANRRAPTE